MRLTTSFFSPLAIICILLTTAAQADSQYPLRAYYPDVPVISTKQLLTDYYSTLVVDIRSKFEYDVAHINRAILLPLTDDDFALKLNKYRPKDDPKPIVFYCNGHACAKSYQAAQLAISLGFKNVYTYDSGIFDWIDAAPDKATLMGETPARANRIISPEEFLKHQIGPDEFALLAQEKDTVIIDIRDPFQRHFVPKGLEIRNIPLDPLLDLVVSRIWTEKRLLFFDAVGKQVRWLQYFLESYDYYDYAFLEDGIQAFAHQPGKLQPIIDKNRSIISDQSMLMKLTSDSRLDNTDRKVLSYLLANVKFNNYVVINLEAVAEAAGVKRHLLLGSVKKFSNLKYAIHSTLQNTLIVQVDPRIAWKGTVGDSTWDAKLQEFKRMVQ